MSIPAVNCSAMSSAKTIQFWPSEIPPSSTAAWKAPVPPEMTAAVADSRETTVMTMVVETATSRKKESFSGSWVSSVDFSLLPMTMPR